MNGKIASFFAAIAAAVTVMTSCADIGRYAAGGTGEESAAESALTEAAAVETRASEGLKLKKDSTGSYCVLAGIGNCTDGVVVIPEEYEGLPVREIKKSAFDSCDSITEVIIPASVTKIGDFAFRGCPRLEKAVLGCVAEIGLSMFEDCVSLETVFLPDGTAEIFRLLVSLGYQTAFGTEIDMRGRFLRMHVAEGRRRFSSLRPCLHRERHS